jgi:hypothetical protein
MPNAITNSEGQALSVVADSAAGANLSDAALANTTGAAGVFRGIKRFASGASSLDSHSFGQVFDFTADPASSDFRSLFAVITLERVQLTFTSLVALSLDTAPWILRVGLVPRGTTDSASGSSTAEIYPWLHQFVVSATLHNTKMIVFAREPAEGEFPFPPGLQLDLKAPAIWHPKPVGIILNSSRNTTRTDVPICYWHVEYELLGEGRTFGA